ncbi:hypothetical protein ACPV5U_27900 [Vibrio mediterranei]
MRTLWTLLLILLSSAANAAPQAFGIRINHTTLDEVKRTHHVTPITERDPLHNPAPCQDSRYDCPSLTPIDGVHAYTVDDIKDSGVQYFEVRTDDAGLVKFILVKLDNPDRGALTQSLQLDGYFRSVNSGYRSNYDYDHHAWYYLRTLYEKQDVWASVWVAMSTLSPSGQKAEFFFVTLSDKEYLKTTRYDLTPYYNAPETPLSEQF